MLFVEIVEKIESMCIAEMINIVINEGVYIELDMFIHVLWTVIQKFYIFSVIVSVIFFVLVEIEHVCSPTYFP